MRPASITNTQGYEWSSTAVIRGILIANGTVPHSLAARACSISFSLSARPSVNWSTPSAVQRRYEGIGWYVSARIYNAICANEQENTSRKCLPTLPSSTRTEARMSSGSPIRPRAGILRLSAVERGGCARGKTGERVSAHTMYVHPSLLRLDGAVLLDVIYAVGKRALNRFMQNLAEPGCPSQKHAGVTTSSVSY